MSLPQKICATCEAEKPLTDFIGRQRSCRDCSTKARREKAAQAPGAAEKRARKPRVEHTEELAQRVLDAIAEGATLSEIALIPGMPQVRDVARWRATVDGFEAAYLAARATRADVRVDGIAKNTRDMRSGHLDVNVGKAVNESLRWLAGKDKPNEYADKPLIDARQIAVNGAAMPQRSESMFETARWVALLLSETAREHGHKVVLEQLEPDDASASGGQAAAPELIEEAQVIEPAPDVDVWKTGVARFDPQSGRLVSADEPAVVALRSTKVVLLPGGAMTTFRDDEADAGIEERLASWYRDEHIRMNVGGG